jgi:hypothetical protein
LPKVDKNINEDRVATKAVKRSKASRSGKKEGRKKRIEKQNWQTGRARLQSGVRETRSRRPWKALVHTCMHGMEESASEQPCEQSMLVLEM